MDFRSFEFAFGEAEEQFVFSASLEKTTDIFAVFLLILVMYDFVVHVNA